MPDSTRSIKPSKTVRARTTHRLDVPSHAGCPARRVRQPRPPRALVSRLYSVGAAIVGWVHFDGRCHGDDDGAGGDSFARRPPSGIAIRVPLSCDVGRERTPRP